jgi:hypothetical protein
LIIHLIQNINSNIQNYRLYFNFFNNKQIIIKSIIFIKNNKMGE